MGVKILPYTFQHLIWLPLRAFTMVFCRLELRGVENVRGLGSNVIIASNHASELDGPLICMALPFFSRQLPLIYVSRDKGLYADNPRGFLYGGKFFRMIGAYPAYVGLKDYEKSLRHHLAAVKDGYSVCIFPVGKKHTLDQVNVARGGVGYLAHKTALPIVPVLIEEVADLSFVDYLRGKGRLRVTFGSPLYADDIFSAQILGKDRTTKAACEQAAATLMNHIVALGDEVPQSVFISDVENADGIS